MSSRSPSRARWLGDSSVAATAMRGVAEELLGASKAGQPGFSHGQTISLLRRLDASGRVLRHLGRRPEATHRSFVLRADHLFEGGIDVAVARFQVNDEAVGVTLVPLAGLTGASGEVHVTDVDGQAWTLRDGRHLGERRIQAAKEDMSCDAGPSWLASAFKANRLAEGEIQALCRWRSVDSIRIYGRMDMEYQARCRENASTAVFSTINATSLIPELDPIRYSADGAPLLPTAQNVEASISAAA